MPVVQAIVLPDGLYQLGAEWTNEDGLSKTHRVKVGYEYNDEELAIHRGERQDDGSYVYVSPKGRVCIRVLQRRLLSMIRAKLSSNNGTKHGRMPWVVTIKQLTAK